jgi:hypothetical protein
MLKKIPEWWKNDKNCIRKLVYRILDKELYYSNEIELIEDMPGFADMLCISRDKQLWATIRYGKPPLLDDSIVAGYRFEDDCNLWLKRTSDEIWAEIIVKKNDAKFPDIYANFREMDLFFYTPERKILPSSAFQFMFPRGIQGDYVIPKNTFVFGECKLTFPHNVPNQYYLLSVLLEIKDKVMKWFIPMIDANIAQGLEDRPKKIQIILFFNTHLLPSYDKVVEDAIADLSLARYIKIRICYVKGYQLRTLLEQGEGA